MGLLFESIIREFQAKTATLNLRRDAKFCESSIEADTLHLAAKLNKILAFK